MNTDLPPEVEGPRPRAPAVDTPTSREAERDLKNAASQPSIGRPS